jgi:hypothetical protein
MPGCFCLQKYDRYEEHEEHDSYDKYGKHADKVSEGVSPYAEKAWAVSHWQSCQAARHACSFAYID